MPSAIASCAHLWAWLGRVLRQSAGIDVKRSDQPTPNPLPLARTGMYFRFLRGRGLLLSFGIWRRSRQNPHLRGGGIKKVADESGSK